MDIINKQGLENILLKLFLQRLYYLSVTIILLALNGCIISEDLSKKTPNTVFPEPTTNGNETHFINPISKYRQTILFENIWETVKNNYVYIDFNGVDWNAIHDEYRKKIDNGLSDDDFYRQMEEMINQLGDDHSQFISPSRHAL